MIKVSIGVMAYNEEGIIGAALASILSQKTKETQVLEIVVVCSGCTDGTERIVREYSKRNQKVRLLLQQKREGKASAINLFMKDASGEVLVVAGGDTKPFENAIEELLSPFLDAGVGMTGGHPVPVNDRNTLLGFTAHLLWGLHHELAMQFPKLGELIAFRNVIGPIPIETAVDELSIEAAIRAKGLRLKYCPEAVVYNRAPLTVKDFLKQRRRIYCGHLWVKKTEGYAASSMSGLRILRLVLKNLKFSGKELVFTFSAVGLEVLGRLLGIWDFYILRKNPAVWEVIGTTKKF